MSGFHFPSARCLLSLVESDPMEEVVDERNVYIYIFLYFYLDLLYFIVLDYLVAYSLH